MITFVRAFCPKTFLCVFVGVT